MVLEGYYTVGWTYDGVLVRKLQWDRYLGGEFMGYIAVPCLMGECQWDHLLLALYPIFEKMIEDNWIRLISWLW